mmetsp:Transcript_21888/g.50711  ORF Transcript_21888/g.50711 Transcript_21888/m.50711 type:complete len:271 (+) Transcript_21888:711-1523(+)
MVRRQRRLCAAVGQRLLHISESGKLQPGHWRFLRSFTARLCRRQLQASRLHSAKRCMPLSRFHLRYGASLLLGWRGRLFCQPRRGRGLSPHRCRRARHLCPLDLLEIDAQVLQRGVEVRTRPAVLQNDFCKVAALQLAQTRRPVEGLRSQAGQRLGQCPHLEIQHGTTTTHGRRDLRRPGLRSHGRCLRFQRAGRKGHLWPMRFRRRAGKGKEEPLWLRSRRAAGGFHQLEILDWPRPQEQVADLLAHRAELVVEQWIQTHRLWPRLVER